MSSYQIGLWGAAMALINWSSALTANCIIAGDRSSGIVPGVSDDAIISTGGDYMVSSTTTIDVNSITIGDTGATVFVSDPGSTITVGSGLTNSSTGGVDAADGDGGSRLSMGGVLTNSGTTAIGVNAPTTVTRWASATPARSPDYVSGWEHIGGFDCARWPCTPPFEVLFFDPGDAPCLPR
jgi:hypothetical protein